MIQIPSSLQLRLLFPLTSFKHSFDLYELILFFILFIINLIPLYKVAFTILLIHLVFLSDYLVLTLPLHARSRKRRWWLISERVMTIVSSIGIEELRLLMLLLLLLLNRMIGATSMITSCETRTTHPISNQQMLRFKSRRKHLLHTMVLRMLIT